MPRQPWFVERRAENLAFLYLTRLSDVLVLRNPNPDGGLDLQVELVGARRGRVFGVEVKSSMDNKDLFRAPGLLRRKVISQLHKISGDYPYHIIFMIFNARNEEGFAGWIKEPTTAHGQSSLKMVSDPKTHTLTTASLRALVKQINDWYEHRDSGASSARTYGTSRR